MLTSLYSCAKPLVLVTKTQDFRSLRFGSRAIISFRRKGNRIRSVSRQREILRMQGEYRRSRRSSLASANGIAFEWAPPISICTMSGVEFTLHRKNGSRATKDRRIVHGKGNFGVDVRRKNGLRCCVWLERSRNIHILGILRGVCVSYTYVGAVHVNSGGNRCNYDYSSSNLKPKKIRISKN